MSVGLAVTCLVILGIIRGGVEGSSDISFNVNGATSTITPSSSSSLSDGIIRMHVDDDHNDGCDRTTPIFGPYGLCVDVKDGRDNNGNPIQLWPCGPQANQQWTFRKDGTIRSLGKCMTTYAYSPSSYIMIFDCATAAQDATKWTISTNGTITNPRSGLVLTATSALQGTTLTVEEKPYQQWLATF